MLTFGTKSTRVLSSSRKPLPLENGDALQSREFLRRYVAMPEIKKAELIMGKVYMGSPVRADAHAKQDGFIHTWLGVYVANTPGTEFYPNATLLLDSDNTLQPDSMLCIRPECGGRSRLNRHGYAIGQPELVVEIAASSVSIDARDKWEAYRRAGVLEYLLWRTNDNDIDWFVLEDKDYLPVKPDSRGILRGRTFAGLALLQPALLKLDLPAVLAALQAEMNSAHHAKFVKRLAGHARAK